MSQPYSALLPYDTIFIYVATNKFFPLDCSFIQYTGFTSQIKKISTILSSPHYSLCALALMALYSDSPLKAE